VQVGADRYAEVEDITSPQTYPAALQRWPARARSINGHGSAWNISQRFSPLRENDKRQTAALTALTQQTPGTGRRQVLKMAAWISVGTLLAWGKLASYATAQSASGVAC
jgi:transmembrane sensor